MKNTLKLAIMCIALCTALLTFSVGSKISYAVDGELDIFSNSENDVNDIEEEESESEETETETTETKTEDIEEEEEEQKPAQEPEKKQEEAATTTTETKAETVEETKLPQTGEKENFIMIVGAFICTVLAVFAYKKAKKYNI